MLKCKLVSSDDATAWAEFAAEHAPESIYHAWEWKAVIEGAYRHSAPYLIARRGAEPSGILPLVHIDSWIFGNTLTSLPYVDFGGIVSADPESQAALLAMAQSLATTAGADFLELRQRAPIEGAAVTSTHKALMLLELAASEDEAWAALPSERRNRVRKAEKESLSVEPVGIEALPLFYDIWTTNMRDLGSPPHSFAFFENILRAFEERSTIFLVKLADQYIGAAMSLYTGNTITVPWVSSLREFFNVYPNNILYWEVMKFAIRRGIRTFDFGRSTYDSGTFKFKSRWGAKPAALHWQRYPIRRQEVASGEDAEGFGAAIEVWKRLPVALTRVIGPAIRKNIAA